MDNSKVYAMKFAKVYPLLVTKAEKKGRTREEVDKATGWLTGYTGEDIRRLLESDISYGDFFLNAPCPNPLRNQIRGKICGVDIETMEEPLMQDIRRLDKMVDDLTKGKKPVWSE